MSEIASITEDQLETLSVYDMLLTAVARMQFFDNNQWADLKYRIHCNKQEDEMVFIEELVNNIDQLVRD